MIDSIEFGEIEVNTNVINPVGVTQFLGMLGFPSSNAVSPVGTDG